MLSLASRGMPTGHPSEAGDGLLGDWHAPGCGPATPAFTQRVDHVLRGGRRELGIAEGTPAALRGLRPAGATAQEADAGMAVDLPPDEMAVCRPAQHMAFRMNTRSSVQVGALHGVLLQHSWSLSQGLHPTRHCVSTLLR